LRGGAELRGWQRSVLCSRRRLQRRSGARPGRGQLWHQQRLGAFGQRGWELPGGAELWRGSRSYFGGRGRLQCGIERNLTGLFDGLRPTVENGFRERGCIINALIRSGLLMRFSLVGLALPNEAGPALSRDGHWLVFCSNGLPGFGESDLFASFRKDTSEYFGRQDPVYLRRRRESRLWRGRPNCFS